MVREILKIYTDEGKKDMNPSFKGIEITEYTYSSTRMGMPQMTATLMWPECLDNEWTGKEYVTFRGERYYIRHTPSSSKDNADARYKHELIFHSERDELLANVYFVDAVYNGALTYDKPCSNSTTVTFYGNIREFCDRLNCALRYAGVGDSILENKTSLTTLDEPVGDGYCVMLDPYGDYDRDESKEFSFSDQYLWDVISQGYESFEVPFEMRGKKIVFGAVPQKLEHKFKYGYDNELLSVKKNNANAKVINRITMLGSSENIPHFYPNETEYGHISIAVKEDNKALSANMIEIANMTQLLSRMNADSVAVLEKSSMSSEYGDPLPIESIQFSYDNGAFKNWEIGSWTATYTQNPVLNDRWHFIVTFDIPSDGEYKLNGLLGNIWTPGTVAPVGFEPLLSGAYPEKIVRFGNDGGVVGQGEKTYAGINFGFLAKGRYAFFFYMNIPRPSDGSQYHMNPALRFIDIQITSVNKIGYEGYIWRVGERTYKTGELGIKITSPLTDSMIGDGFGWAASDRLNFQTNLMPPKYRNTLGAERFYNAVNGIYVNPDTDEEYMFPNPYKDGAPNEYIYKNDEIKPTIAGVRNAEGLLFGVIADIAFDSDDNDLLVSNSTESSDKNDSLKYEHSYFYIKLNIFNGIYGFDLFKHALQTDPMTIQMTSGGCDGCKFKIQALEYTDDSGLKSYKNPVQTSGENGYIVPGGYSDKVKEEWQVWQQDTTSHSIWICVQKDAETFGVIMPNKGGNYRPKIGDTFNIVNIDLPEVYIKAAEKRLEQEGIRFLFDNNEEKFTFDISASRIFFANNPDILAQIDEYSIIDVEYNGKTYEQYVSAFNVNCKDSEALPDIQVNLTDTLAVGESFVQNVAERALSLIPNATIMGGSAGFGPGGLNTSLADKRYINKQRADKTPYKLSSDVGFEVGEFMSGSQGGLFYKDPETGIVYLEVDKLKVRMKAIFEELQIAKVDSIGGKQIITPGGSVLISFVEELDDVYRCYFKAKEEDKGAECRFVMDDQVQCREFNIQDGTKHNAENRFYWRKVIAVNNDEYYVDLSKEDCAENSDIPQMGDTICQLGNRTNTERQSAIILSTVDEFAPCVTLYNGIDNYTLENKAVVEYGVDKSKNPPRPFFHCYGEAYVGPRDGSTYIKYTPENGVEIKGKLSVESTVGDQVLEEYIKQVSPPVEQEDIEQFVNNIVDPKIEGIQNQIDGVIETWFLNGVPTLTNYPASEWNTDVLKIQHLGDLYYDNDTGTAYRFSQNADKSYYWNVITDDAITKALTAAKKAQDTADKKRRIFTTQPTIPYDKGDLWVNATYPSGTTADSRDPLNNKYYNDILRCGTSKSTGSFSIGDWGLSSNYTDDTLAQSAKEVADAAKERLDTWAADGVISPTEKQGIKDEIARIDGDKSLVEAEYARYGLGTPTTYNTAYTAYRTLLVSLSADSPENIDIPSDFADKQTTYYTTRTASLSIIAAAAKKYAEDQAEKAVRDYKYLKEAFLDRSTTIGGVFLSSHIRLGEHNESLQTQTVWSGLNGVYEKKRDISFWAGGDAIDLFNEDDTPATLKPGARAAQSLIRMDGSAYFLGGDIQFRSDRTAIFGSGNTSITIANGSVTLGNGIKIDIAGEAKGLADSIASVTNLVNTIGNHLIPTYLDGGVYKETTWAAITNGTHTLAAIKTKEGFFSDKFISAKGASDTAGGAGATQLRMLTDVAINDGTLSAGQALVYNGTKWVNQAIAPGLDETSLATYLTNNNYAKKSDIPSLTGYATESWVTNKGYITSDALTGYATESWVTGKGYITSGALAPYLSKDDAADLYQPKGNYLTEHQNIYALTLQTGAFSAKTYNPKTGAVTVNIPTTTSHISEGANKYFTDARAVAALKTTTDTLQANIDKKLDTATFNTFKALFDSMFVKEADANSPEGYRIKAVFGLYSPYYLSAKGANPDGGGGGSAFGLYTDWAQTPSSTDALGAVLGKSLYTKQNEHTTAISGLTSRVTALEGKNYLDSLEIAVTGTGNAVTSVSQSTDKKKLTFTKGSTFLTGITKAMVENVLTGNITSHTHSQYLTTTSASSTYLSKTDAGTTYLKKTDAASTYVEKEEGKGLSEKNFTTALLNKLNGIAEGANKYVLPVAKAAVLGGVMIGTSLSVTAAGLLDLPDKGTAGTYTKVTVDVKGRVTAGATLAATDIPTLAISKVSGLQTALDSKAAQSDFDTLKTWIEDLFEKVTLTGGATAIRAKYGLYSNDFISAKGASDSSGGAGGVGYGRLDSWAAYVEGNGYVLSADLGFDLHKRLLNVYGKTTIDNKLAGIYTKTEADGRFQPKGNYLTGITKSQVEAVLTGTVTTHTHNRIVNTGVTDLDVFKGNAFQVNFGQGGNTHTGKPTDTDAYGVMSFQSAGGWFTQILRSTNTNNGLFVRDFKGGSWGAWDRILTESNYSTVLDSHYALKTSLTSHTGNTTVHITAAERTKWNKVVTDFAAITGTDSDTIINKWEEVVAFLDTYTEADTLAKLLGNKADKTQLADYVTLATAQTITGLKTFNGSMAMGVNHYIYGVNESAGSMLHFDGSRTVIGSCGATSTVATHLRSKTGHLTCGADNTASYNILDTGNYSGTLDGRYMTLGTAQTITGVKTYNANIALGANYAITSASAASAKITKTTGFAIHGGADKAAEDDANLRFGSWYGIGWYPTISGQTVAQGTNAMWLNVRTGVLTVAGKFVKKGGTSTQFLKADGSVDGTAYLPKSTFDTFKTLFDSMFEKVTTNGVTTIRAKFGLWTNEFLSAKGQSSDSGSAGGGLIQKVYGSSDLGKTFADATLTDTFNAYTINKIRTDLSARITSLEGGSALSVTTTGSGNAITAITKSGTVITATKGATFLTAHQKLDYINNLGKLTAVSGTTTMPSGLRLYSVYSNGYPSTYGNLLRVGGGGSGELLCGWTDNTALGRLYYRSKRDVASTEWSAWGTVAYLTDLTWGNVTGKPTNFVTTDTVQTITGAKTFTSANANCITLRRSNTDGGAFIDYYALNNTTEYWRVGMASDKTFGFAWKDALTNAKVDSSGNIFATAFKKSGSSDSYLLLGGGGHKALSDLATASALTSGLAGKVSKSGDTMTGALQINIDNAVKHLGFGRAGYNYICATASGGILGFVANGKAAGAASHCDLIVENNAVHPGTTNVATLGTSALRWSNVYATTLNVTSTSLVTNLNADMLDGFHISNYQTGGWTGLLAFNQDSSTNYARYSHKLFKIDSPIDCILRFRVTTGINYPSYGEWVLRVNHTTNYAKCVSLVPAGINASGFNLTVYIDSDYGVWVQTNAIWSSTFQYRVERGTLPSAISTVSGTPPNVVQTIVNSGMSRNGASYSAVTLQGNADSATKLADNTTFNAWGQTFFTNGKPKAVDGAMTINYTGETGILLKRAEAGSGAFIRFYNNNQTANYFRMGMYGAGYFGVGYNGAAAISISTANNVGIGTTSPSYKLDVNGIIKSNNEIRTTAANGFRIAYGNYGFFIRNDGSNTYFMMTNSGDANGSYNSLRPLYINDSTGRVTMGNGLAVNEATVTTLKIGSVTITYDSANGGLKISGGGLYSDSYISAKGASTASGGASGYGLAKTWPSANPGTGTTDALGLNLGYELYVNKLDKSAGVTALGTSGNYLTWTKNGTVNNLTVPYATTAASLTGTEEHKGTALADFDTTKTRTYQATTDLGDGISYSAILSVSAGSSHRYFQIIGGKGNVNFLRWRTTDANGATLGAVRRLLDDNNYSTILDGRYYTESEVNTKLTDGSVTKVGTATVGGTAKPIYLNAGTPTALSATVGAANRPVYLNAGTITAGTYTFGNASGNAPISNGTINTNLNADLLDGVHASGLFTALANSGDSISATIGGTTKTLTVGYALRTNRLTYCTARVGSTNNWKFHRILRTNAITSSYSDYCGIYVISQGYSGGNFGIFRVAIRTNSGTSVSSCQVEWIVRKGFAQDSIQVGFNNTLGNTYADVFYVAPGTYTSATVSRLVEGNRGNINEYFILVNSSEVDGTTTSDKKTSTEVYSSLANAASVIGRSYNANVTSGSDVGHVSTASKLQTARTINGTSFDGSANITTASWGTARNIGIVNSDGTGTAVVTSVNGAANVNLRLPATIKAALTGNATTATTLQNARTLWGQSFNGGANVSGSLSSVGNITGSGAMTISSTNGRLTLNGAATALDLKFANTDAKSVILNGTAFKPYDAADNALELGTDAARWKKITACNMRLSSSTSGSGADVYAELWRGGAASWKMLNTGGVLKFQSNYTTAAGDYFDCMTLAYNTGNAYIKGSVGIGTTNPQHKLDVNGNIRANGWLRTTGATGWVNDTYGGGLCMTDATWVRIYGSKSFYQASGILRTDGTLQVGASGTYLNASSGGMTLGVNLDLKSGHSIHPTTDKTCNFGTPANRWSRIYAAAACIGSNGTETDEAALQNTTFVGGGYMELYRDTPFIDFHFGNSTKDYTSRIIEEASGRLAVIGTLRVSVGMYSDGYVSAKGQNTSSDIRKKSSVSTFHLGLDDILNAPSVKYKWKDTGKKDVGTIAQYWLNRLPDAVGKDLDGFYTVDYGKLAHIEVVSLANILNPRLSKTEREIQKLKAEVKRLRQKVAELEAR